MLDSSAKECRAREVGGVRGLPKFPQLDAAVSNVRREIFKVGNMVRDVARRLKMEEPCPDEGFTMRVTQTKLPSTLAILPRGNFAAIIPGDSVAETVITSGIANTLNLYQSALIVRVILTWFPQAPQGIVSPLSTICDPYLNLFRGIIPPIGGTFDLSPILAFVVLDFLTGSAASLGAEIPKDMEKGQEKS